MGKEKEEGVKRKQKDVGRGSEVDAGEKEIEKRKKKYEEIKEGLGYGKMREKVKKRGSRS